MMGHKLKGLQGPGLWQTNKCIKHYLSNETLCGDKFGLRVISKPWTMSSLTYLPTINLFSILPLSLAVAEKDKAILSVVSTCGSPCFCQANFTLHKQSNPWPMNQTIYNRKITGSFINIFNMF